MSEKLKKKEKISVILDTSTYVSALLSKEGISAKIFEFIIKGELFNFYTEEIIAEVNDVLNREKFNLQKDKIEHFISLIKQNSFLVQQLENYKIIKCRDPQDDKFLSLSSQIEANYLITWDDDLLVLKEINSTKIINPEKFNKILKSKGSKDEHM